MKHLGTNHDGYHTFDELYTHRHLLFLNFIQHNNEAWKSKLHSDGTMFDDMFIAGIELRTGMITYHIPIKYWDSCYVSILEKAPEWNGYTSDDVCNRLEENL